jgi:probable O-glycosylation ligase (exosortase A-associated)
LGYVWVDTFQPQQVAFILLNQFPVAMIMGLAALGSYLLMDRRSAPPITLFTVMVVAMTVWVTCTTLWAQVPDAAWEKWDWAFKTLGFSAFIPFVIRSRVQIEAFVQTYVFSLAANFIPFGLKVLISGGGYGMNLGLQAGNSGLSEGGLLSTSCLMAVPLAIFLSAHSTLVPRLKVLSLAYWGVAGLAITTAIGTYERSALLGLGVLGAYMWVRTRHKFGFGVVVALVACILVYNSSSAWNSRISTVGTYQSDNSAFVRILVWRWTLGFVATHPFGGGFATYIIDHIEVPAEGPSEAHVEFGRAFHSIYFEVLGEHGYPGIILFLMTAVGMVLKLRGLARTARPYPELQWVVGLSDALQSGIVVFLACGAFVGIAFQPMFWYFIATGVSLSAYMWRVERQNAVAEVGWRAMATYSPGGGTSLPGVPDWRHRAAGNTAVRQK